LWRREVAVGTHARFVEARWFKIFAMCLFATLRSHAAATATRVDETSSRRTAALAALFLNEWHWFVRVSFASLRFRRRSALAAWRRRTDERVCAIAASARRRTARLRLFVASSRWHLFVSSRRVFLERTLRCVRAYVARLAERAVAGWWLTTRAKGLGRLRDQRARQMASTRLKLATLCAMRENLWRRKLLRRVGS
jgi:hypothetical protein